MNIFKYYTTFHRGLNWGSPRNSHWRHERMSSTLICLQMSLDDLRSQNWYNRIMKQGAILQIWSHLLKVTSLLKYIIGTRNQVIQYLPISQNIDCDGRASKKIGPYVPNKSFLFLSTIMTKSSQTQHNREIQQCLLCEGPISVQPPSSGSLAEAQFRSSNHFPRCLFWLAFYWQ